VSHQSVLLTETMEAMAIQPDGIYVDATFGRGGHAKAILDQLIKGKLIALDQDEAAIKVAKALQQDHPQLLVFRENFEHLNAVLDALNIDGIDGILFDLGVSSPQLDERDRGFSYRSNDRLDMRMDQRQSFDAYTVVNTYSYEQLKSVLKRYGEEPYAKQIARKIERARELGPIETTDQLVNIIKSALPSKVLSAKGHPAKQSFMAIRIEVNRELEVLENVLEDAVQRLRPNGRCAVISFHSLEDRLVKQIFQKYVEDPHPSKLPIAQPERAAYRLYTRKPITASERELKENSRAHSAKLRVLIKN
jgi:16S rRNA (cytosine1402-N4)-methyltransferase